MVSIMLSLLLLLLFLPALQVLLGTCDQQQRMHQMSPCPRVGRRSGSEMWATVQFTVPLLWDTIACLIPKECPFFFFPPFFGIMCIISEHYNTAHFGRLCTDTMIYQLELLISKVGAFAWKLNRTTTKKKDCNDSNVWSTSRWQQSLMHLIMRPERQTCTAETHIYSILIPSFCIVLVFFLFCCLFRDVAVYLIFFFKCVVSDLLWWYTYLCKFL